jgi:hypothetical protein
VSEACADEGRIGLQAQDRVSRWSSLLILGLYFLKVGMKIGFEGFNLQASTGVALTNCL